MGHGAAAPVQEADHLLHDGDASVVAVGGRAGELAQGGNEASQAPSPSGLGRRGALPLETCACTLTYTSPSRRS